MNSITIGQTITFGFGVETLTGTVTRVGEYALSVLVDAQAPVMAGRVIMLDRECV